MRGWLADLDERVRREVTAIALIAAAVLSYVALYGDGAGWVGGFLQRVLLSLFGRGGAVVVPALVGAGGLALFLGRGGRSLPARLLGTGLAVLALLIVESRELPVTTAAVAVRNGLGHHGGGIIGGLLNWLLVRAFGAVGRDLITLALVLLAVPLTLNVSLGRGAAAALSWARRLGAEAARTLRDFLFEIEEVPGDPGPRRRQEPSQPVGDFAAVEGPRVLHAGETEPAAAQSDRAAAGAPRRRILGLFGPARGKGEQAVGSNGHTGRPLAAEEPAPVVPDREAAPVPDADAPAEVPGTGASRRPAPERGAQAAERGDDAPPAVRVRPYRLPPMTLLQRGRPAPAARSQKEAEAKARQLEVTLENFGVKARVVGVQQGPAVTRFELEPATGVRVSKIQSLANDIALSLAAPDVRIEAPIPGKSLVGIEVPNREISAVYLRDVIDTPEFKDNSSRLTVAVGKDIAGQPVVTSLEKMLHVLIAGATGSGKSVCVNAILGSLLFKARPDEVKLLLIDPKVVELSGYNGIPHLLVPVVTEPKRAAAALAWLVREMERRYERFADAGVRDIGRFNAQAESSGQERLPYIVVVIDELADLMMVAPVDVEDAIQRLAQMARAAGIHLVVATQRPSVDVITGVIKANIPSRIAFAVSSQTDSRVILDMAGAEKLVGKGDMLFYPMGASKPIRVQGAYLSENELEALLAFIRGQGAPEYHEEVLAAAERGDGEPLEGDDDLFPEAVRLVVETGQASVSLLQRRLRVGYTRAGRLIDMMEERGFVGPHQGSKPRDVRITREEYRRIFGTDA